MIKRTIFVLFFIFTSFAFIFSDGLTGAAYFGMSAKQLKKEERKFLKQDDSFDKFANLGLIYHFLSDKGEKVSKLAVENFKKALAIDENAFVVKAYLGSAYTLFGNDKKDATSKMKFANLGIEMMDEVYKAHPDDYEINVLLIYNSLELPDKLFSRLKVAVALVKNMMLKFDTLETEQQAEILFLKASTLFSSSKELEAIDLWQKVYLEYKSTRYSKLAKQKLDLYQE